MYIFVSTGKIPVGTGKFPVSTLVGVFVGILWCVLHRKSLNLRGHFREHFRVHSRGRFREHFRERVRGSNFAVRVLCAFLTSGGTKYVSFEVFLSLLREPGKGRGGDPGTVPLQNPEVTSRKACLRNAEGGIAESRNTGPLREQGRGL